MFDVIVIGAGPVGLVSSLAFATAGYNVAIIDPVDRTGVSSTEKSDGLEDHRTTAHLTPTVKFLEDLGVWDEICSNACALERLVIIEDTSQKLISKRRKRTVFDPSELGNENFGYNVPIQDSLRGLTKLAKANSNIAIFFGVGLRSVVHYDQQVSAILTDGATIEAKLLIGADGGNSHVRKSLGIGVKKKYTGQSALSFHINHERPHFNTSTEIYSDGGPLTLVPMSGQNEGHKSAVVWMQVTDKANFLTNYDCDLFMNHVQEKSCDSVGKIQSCSAINSRPVIVQLANQIIDKRVVLIGEAAHLLPPIGAQGYNLSIRDIKILLEVILKSQHDPGSTATLKKYRLLRSPDIFLRTAGVGALNFLAWSDNPILQGVRSKGLSIFQNSKLLKKSAMRFGLN